MNCNRYICDCCQLERMKMNGIMRVNVNGSVSRSVSESVKMFEYESA